MSFRAWKPYEGSRFPSSFYALRWAACWPLQRRIPIVGLDLRIGETIVIICSALLFVLGALLSPPRFTMHSMAPLFYEKTGQHQSGHLAAFVLALAYATASRNSIFTFFFGLPFERAIFWHK